MFASIFVWIAGMRYKHIDATEGKRKRERKKENNIYTLHYFVSVIIFVLPSFPLAFGEAWQWIWVWARAHSIYCKIKRKIKFSFWAHKIYLSTHRVGWEWMRERESENEMVSERDRALNFYRFVYFEFDFIALVSFFFSLPFSSWAVDFDSHCCARWCVCMCEIKNRRSQNQIKQIICISHPPKLLALLR